MGGEDAHGVGQAHELVLHGVVEHPAELIGGDADGGEKVGAADVPDEEGVAREHAARRVVVSVLVDEDADRLRGVTGGLHDLERHAAEADALAVAQRADLELGLGGAVADPGARLAGELEVAGEEVGVEVRVDDPDDRQTARRRVVEVLRDVTARVDDDGLSGRLVADEVGRLREAVEVVLAEVHESPSGCSSSS